jgi:glyoxylase-like metal-dependent hydrolase (beta-lactamase superfamily II)
MKKLAPFAVIGFAVQAWGQPVPGSMEVRWNEGATDCAEMSSAPLQVHAYELQTFILRQSPCAHFEANFIYLLVGSDKALLIDTGAVADPDQMPLSETVLNLLPDRGNWSIPLVVAHSHGHRDHRMGDAQFASLPSVEVVPAEFEGMRSFFGFDEWPNRIVRFDLGERTVHVIPAPGHHPAHLVFYDDRTELLITGDFLLPGRLLIDDISAYRESALRVVDFLKNRSVTHILGGHIELDADGQPYSRGSQYRPNERQLELAEEDLLALPAALEDFSGFYARHTNFILSNPIHNLLALVVAAVAALAIVAWGLRRILRRRRRRVNASA